MASTLPTIPRFIFTVFEPLSLVAGFTALILYPSWSVEQQIAPYAPENLSPNAIVVARQLGNMYLLAGLIGVAVLYTTAETKVVRNYLIALWLGDIGHILITGHAMGYDGFVDYAGYNAATWGNIGATAFLFVSRTAYFAGLFGSDRAPLQKDKKSL